MNKDAQIHIVEDDLEFGSYLLELFEDENYSNVSWYQDGIEGLNSCLSNLPDLVVLDLNLPLLRGEEVCRLLRSSLTNRHTKILICSDMPQAKQRELEMLQIGADRYVEKPFKEESFLEDVEELLGGEDSTNSHADVNEQTTLSESDEEDEQTRITGPESPEPMKKELSGEIETDQKFTGYVLDEVIGGGASGTVYRAVQQNLDRQVALKVFLKDQSVTDDDIERFRNEARIMARLSHPNIITVFDFGQTGYTYFIVMELMNRGCVLDLIQLNPLKIRFLRMFVDHVFTALSYLHRQEILHQDIKPGNIMVTDEGDLKLGDFGLSVVETSKPRMKRESGFILGTRAYMAPELLEGRPPTALSDQFALGRTILRLFEGEHMRRPRKRITDLRPDMPRQVDSIVEKMMSPEPAHRFKTLEEPRDRLLECLSGLTESR